MEQNTVSSTTELKPSRLLVLGLLGLLASCATGVLVFFFWQHQGLSLNPPSWAWPDSIPYKGNLGKFAGSYLACLAFLPSLALLMTAWLFPLDNKKRLEQLNYALSLDAATYLILPIIVLTLMVWRQLGNGFLALSMVFMGLLLAKSSILIWFFGRKLYFQGLYEKEELPKTWFWIFWLVGFIVLGLAGTFAQGVSPSVGLENHGLKAVELYLGKGATSENSLVSSSGLDTGNLIFVWLFSLVGGFAGRLGGVLISVFWSSLAVFLLWKWLGKNSKKEPMAVFGLSLLMTCLPFAYLSQKAGPFALILALLSAGLLLLDRYSQKLWQAVLGLPLLVFGILFLVLFSADPGGQNQDQGITIARFFATLPDLILQAPILLLALAGFPIAFKYHSKQALLSAMVAVLGLFWLYLGWGLYEARMAAFGVLSLPLLALGLMICSSVFNRPFFSCVVFVPALMGLGLFLLGTLAPYFVVGEKDKIPILEYLSKGSETVFPLAKAQPETVVFWGAGFMVVIGILAFYCWNNYSPEKKERDPLSLTQEEVMGLGIFVAFLPILGKIIF